jgi:hypothetical protein
MANILGSSGDCEPYQATHHPESKELLYVDGKKSDMRENNIEDCAYS